jgi:hypothetical protein
MDENPNIHFSKKILFFSFLFILVNAAWYITSVLVNTGDIYKTVAPKLAFAASQDVQIKTVYDDSYHSATPNQELLADTFIKTGERQFAQIMLDNNVIRLDENTEVTLKENNFAEYSAYEQDLPRLTLSLSSGTLWVNSFDRIEIISARSMAQFSHSVGIVSYTPPMNRVMAITGSADLSLLSEDGKILASFMIPLNNQVTFVDNQILPEYAQLMSSKLKKELKLAPIAQAIYSDEWVVLNTRVDESVAQAKNNYIYSDLYYSLKDKYYKIKSVFTFIPNTRRQLALDRVDLSLRYLLGGVNGKGDMTVAKNILTYIGDLTAGIKSDPLLKQLLTERFFDIKTVKTETPAYLVKDYLLSYILNEDGPQVLRTRLSDLKNSLASFKLDDAKIAAESWIAEWKDLAAVESVEFSNQSQMFQRIILSYADRVTKDMLDIFDESGQMRLDMKPGNDDTRLAITEERLEISSALVSAYRYLAAKDYLKTSYESLGVDKLDTKLASVGIFLESARLIAQRIEYAEEKMHGAAVSINEDEFKTYMSQKQRDELLSENLKAFLEIEKEPELEVTPPEISEVVSRFSDSRIIIAESDITAQADDPFSFEIKNARLVDRSAEGDSITFSAIYDFSSGAVHNVETKGVMLKGNFNLNDLVVILKQNHITQPLPGEPEEDITELLAESESTSDEALRAQLTAQDLAKQLTLNEIMQFGIKVDVTKIRVLDELTLTSFAVESASVQDPTDARKQINFRFDYDSSSKQASNIVIEEPQKTISARTPISQLSQAVISSVYEEKEKQDLTQEFQNKMEDKSLMLELSDIDAQSTSNIIFKNLKLATLPLIVDGVYDLSQDNFKTVTNALYSAENISIEDYFSELARLFVTNYLTSKGISVSDDKLDMTYPFGTVKVVGYAAGGQTYDFVLDVKADKLRNVTLVETGASVDSMSIDEFLNIVAGQS